MRSSRRRAEHQRRRRGDNRERYKWNKKGEDGANGGVRGGLSYLQITSLLDRFLWKLNWARGLKENQSGSLVTGKEDLIND